MKHLILCIWLITVIIISLSIPSSTESYVREKTISDFISDYSFRDKVNPKIVRAIIKCESGYNPNAVGDGGKSFGLVQIHLPSHPNITKEQAVNPEFAIKYLTSELSAGRGKAWTCYRNML